MGSSTQVLMYLSTASTLLELVLAILVSAVLELDCQSTCTFYSISKIGKDDRVFTVVFLSHKASCHET